MTSLIDLNSDPDVQIRLDSYSVPAEARAEFEAGVERSVAFLETLPGFRAHLALAKTSGSSAFNFVTIAVWQSREAMANAIRQVRAHDERLGYDPREAAARLGITADVDNHFVPMHVDESAAPSRGGPGIPPVG